MMWCIRTNNISMDEIYNVDPIESYFEQEKLSGNIGWQLSDEIFMIFDAIYYTQGNQSHSSSGAGTVNCPICSEIVSGRRFAPHLEKCMNGGKRGSKKHYDYIHDDALTSKALVKPKSSESLEAQDAYPKSLIVRIKLKNGGNLTYQNGVHINVCVCSNCVNIFHTSPEG